MTLQTWLAAELRAAGLTVLEVAGWQTRQSRDGFDPQGFVLHDTVTPATLTRTQEQDVLVYGRPDLSGPLAQLGLHRDGVVSVIAAGRANHNGYGLWGNDALGMETFCYGGLAGHEEPYNATQVEVAVEVARVVCAHFDWPPSKVLGHKETDPTRKIDPYGVDMPALRLSIQEDDVTVDELRTELAKWLGPQPGDASGTVHTLLARLISNDFDTAGQLDDIVQGACASAITAAGSTTVDAGALADAILDRMKERL